jgi:exodeoxyribonuclease V beta subunit
MTGVLKWLAEQRDPQSPRLEEHQLRLESDEEAVKIATIHKSKGLEYPVVFCPYGWAGSFIKDNEILFHQPDCGDDDQCLTLDVGSDSRALNIVHAQNELLAENIRLLYVALTRAKSKCYVAWGRINAADSSALAYLLHTPEDAQTDYRTEDLVAGLKKHLGAKSDENRIDDLKRLAKKSQECIEVVSLPEPSDCRFFEPQGRTESLVCRKFSGEIDHTWKISSYSSLVSKRISDVDLPDRDAFDNLFKHLTVTTEDWIEPQQPGQRADIFMFPKGSRTGNFFHDLFEHIDYTSCSSRALSRPVKNALQDYGFDSAWQGIISETISHVLSVSLKATRPKLVLSSIAYEDRINEMEFYFPINAITPNKLRTIFKRYGSINGIEDFPDQLQKLGFRPTAGFMKGYIDLVFEHQDQFYLVDWKSNYLGPKLEDYRQESLGYAMFENYYILQYHLYVLALSQYLRLRNPGFRYESHFGGVFYIFIRGVDSRRGSQYGIYHDLPEPARINALGKALIPGFQNI